ncbi:hypothetical protein DVT68_00050 [Dyella solisilvae]|uniref:Uncharacterized protein n=2 Tax=Dyella solisilvae TaxID=1920168 RepID=A0A370K9J6_9GAMM|nr:hypothetical protein DVT68_00050 [Dyella solisilvae]
MNWIIQEAAPVPILETNIYAFPTEQAKDLTSEAKSTAPFHLLMKWIDPEVILVHGNEAQKYLKERGIGRFRIEVKHFSRGWSKDEAVAIGRRIKLTCLREA